jgi:ABC-2 type transport system permease protein
MTALVSKYQHVFGMGLQSGLVYRWTILVRVAFSLLHFASVRIFWGAAFEGKETIGGFNFFQTMSYFLGVVVINYLISAHNEDYQISEEIRNGLINQFLTKPINYFGYRVTLFFANRLITGLVTLVPVLLLLPLLKDYFPEQQDMWRWALAVPALFQAAMIQFCIAYCFGLLAFWFLEIQGFVILSFAVETLLSGQIFPLDLLPGPIFQISQWLPFYYQMYFPVAVITGRITSVTEIAGGLAIQAGWVLVLIALGNILWKAGLGKHTAVGG